MYSAEHAEIIVSMNVWMTTDPAYYLVAGFITQ